MGLSQKEWLQSERAIIDKFFRVKVPEALRDSGKADIQCTETSCIEYGKQVLSADDLVRTDNQGSNSYTLVCKSKSQIIQFRLRPFDTAVLELAHQIYGDKVPQVTLHAGFPLPVYSSSIIHGKVHIFQPFPEDAFPLERQTRTVTDLGRFIARSTYFPQPKSSYKNDSWTVRSKETLDRLHRNSSLQVAAPEIADIVSRLRGDIHLLHCLPAVLTHHDFSEVNILVGKDGLVTGVIDFDAAGIEAFGMCIWGIYECFLGSMEQGKWSFFDQEANGRAGHTTVRSVLEAAFWNSLWSNISPEFERGNIEAALKVAVSMGVLMRYFIKGMVDEIDERKKVHRLSLEYAEEILPAVQIL